MDFGKVLKSFAPQNTLNTDVWKNNKLHPQVRKILLKVASKFISDWNLKKKIKIHDVRFTGSLAAYNWSKFSDIDLHIVVDYKDVDDDLDLVERFFTVIKSNWNDKHNIKIKNFEIEVYVENLGEDHTATGLYSVLHDKWIKEPEQSDMTFDEEDITSKAKYFFNLYDNVLVKKYKEKKYSEVISIIKDTKEKIRRMRSSGLSTGGEFSVENLAFKVLRRTGLLKKMSELLVKSTDRELSEKNIPIQTREVVYVCKS